MMIYICLEFFSAPSPSWGMGLKSRSQTKIFHTNDNDLAYITKQTLIDFTGVCYRDSYRSEVLLSMIPATVSYLCGQDHGLHIMCD